MELELEEALSTAIPADQGDDEEEEGEGGFGHFMKQQGLPSSCQPVLECFHFSPRVEPDLDLLFAGRVGGLVGG